MGENISRPTKKVVKFISSSVAEHQRPKIQFRHAVAILSEVTKLFFLKETLYNSKYKYGSIFLHAVNYKINFAWTEKIKIKHVIFF
jgi:hypothetical protein